MINKSFTKETGNKVIEEGYADMVAYGEPLLQILTCDSF
jgi:N-ethylmaleimide reductase